MSDVDSSRAAHQRVEGRIELQEIRLVASPVKRRESGQSPQRLRRHRAFHRMKLEGLRALPDRDHLASRIAEVPGEMVHVTVNVTGRTGAGAVAGELGIVEKAAADADGQRRRVGADPYLANHGLRDRVDHRDRVGNPVQHVQRASRPALSASPRGPRFVLGSTFEPDPLGGPTSTNDITLPLVSTCATRSVPNAATYMNSPRRVEDHGRRLRERRRARRRVRQHRIVDRRDSDRTG